MNYRTAVILADESLSGSGTKTIDINIADIISRINMKWYVTKSATGMNSYAHKDITKIELVDGSDVLHSTDGGQNQALAIFDRKCPTMAYGQYIGANSQQSMFAIDFGRRLFDPVLAFDPKRFKNPQLKISYDSDVSDTGCTSGTMQVVADCFDEKQVSPMGFLSAKAIYSAVPPASGYRYIDLPTDRILKRMLVQGYLSAYEPWYTVSEVKLDEDNDKRILFDWNMEDYYKFRQSIDPKVIDKVMFQSSASGQDLYLTPTDYWADLVAICTTAGSSIGTGTTGKGGYHDLTCSTNVEAHGSSSGWLPNHCFNFPFGNQDDMEDWYDVTKVGNLRLRLKVGTYSASATMAVILQQLRNY